MAKTLAVLSLVTVEKREAIQGMYENSQLLLSGSHILTTNQYHYRYTADGDSNNVYAILVEWPEDGSVLLGAFKGIGKPHSVEMLGYEGEYLVKQILIIDITGKYPQ